MTNLRITASRVLALFSRSRRDADLNDEIQAHLGALTDDFVHSGMSIDEARAAAQRAFGGVMQMQESYRDQRGWPMLDAFAQDFRFAVRSLVKNRSFAAA